MNNEDGLLVCSFLLLVWAAILTAFRINHPKTSNGPIMRVVRRWFMWPAMFAIFAFGVPFLFAVDCITGGKGEDLFKAMLPYTVAVYSFIIWLFLVLK